MSTPSVIQGDQYINGTLGCQAFNPPAGSILDAAIAGSGASGVAASKLITHFRLKDELFALGTTVTAIASKYVFTAVANGSLVAMKVVITGAVPTGDHAFTVDLKKSTGGGAFATVLSGVVTCNSGATLLVPVSGTISSAAYVAGDTFELVVAVSGSTGSQATGLGVTLEVSEQYV